jgi:hypothetical protein
VEKNPSGSTPSAGAGMKRASDACAKRVAVKSGWENEGTESWRQWAIREAGSKGNERWSDAARGFNHHS